MGVPKQTVSPNTASVGHSTRLVTISAITPDGQTAICVDKNGTEARVPVLIQRAKGQLPVAGEQWIIAQDISAGWSFAAIASTTDAPFELPPPPPPAPGSIPGSALEPGSVTGNELAVQSVGALNLATNAAGTNIILDPAFTSPAINANRLADPATAGVWVIASPTATASGASLATLALMPSDLVPLYVNPGEQYYLAVTVSLSGGTGVTAGIQFVANTGAFLGPVLPVSAGTSLVAQLVTIPPGVSSAYVRIIVSGLAGAATAAFSSPVCYNTVGNTQLQLNSVAASNIVANSIGVAQLQAGLVYAGIVDATVVTGATLQNSTVNPRTSINPDGSITITNASGAVIFKIGPDGTIDWYNSAGLLQMELQPGGTQIIYSSLTGPASTDFEPPSAPQILFTTFSASSTAAYVSAIGQAVSAGAVVTVVTGAAGATAATACTDSQGNTYTLISSNTTGQYQQIFQAVNVHALGTSDTITVTYAAANTQQKNFIAAATNFVPTVTPIDFLSSPVTGTSVAPSATGTPTAFGDSLLFIASWGTAGGVGTMPDGWQQATYANVAGQQYTEVWYSTNVAPSGPVTATATITSAPWCAVLLAYKAAPAQPLSLAPVPTNVVLSASTIWAVNGVFSCKATKSGTAAIWGVTFPPFSVQAGSGVSARANVYTQNVALPALDWGITFWSGPNGTGTNLGSDSYSLYYGLFSAIVGVNFSLGWNTTAPAGAVSATFWVMENQADTAGNYFLIDAMVVPGGLVYSNSPIATSDSRGNQIDQGINFVGLPGLTNVFGVEDPYSGNQLASIDGSGDIQGQTVSAVNDLFVGGQSVPNDLIDPLPLGLLNYGYLNVSGGWPSTPIAGTEIALFELDQAVTNGRVIEFLMNQSIINVTAAGSAHIRLRYTTDGSTPTTSSSLASMSASRVETASTDAAIGPLRCLFYPLADGVYKFLVTGQAGSGSFQFKNDPFVRCMVYDWGANPSVNNLVILGSAGGGSGAPSQQQYTENFYPANTYCYDQWGLKNHNGSMYQGAYSGSSYDEHSWIAWANGSRGNSLTSVLNTSVQSVKLRLLNLHSWYNAGMTVSMRWARGTAGNTGIISGEITNWHINEGQLLSHSLSPSQWAPWQTGGTWMVFKAGSLTLDRYGYFYGAGSTGSAPQLQVKYTA